MQTIIYTVSHAQVREEYTESGGILQTESPCYKLKRRIAMMVGHSMSEVGSFVAEDIEARNSILGSVQEVEADMADWGNMQAHHKDENPATERGSSSEASRANVDHGSSRTHKKLYHCAGFPLWNARATEELSRGSASAGISRPLYGVLVCLRPVTSLEFRPTDCVPLQCLCTMAAEHVVSIRRKVERLGESFVRRMSLQAQKELDDKHGGDVGRCVKHVFWLANRLFSRITRLPRLTITLQ